MPGGPTFLIIVTRIIFISRNFYVYLFARPKKNWEIYKLRVLLYQFLKSDPSQLSLSRAFHCVLRLNNLKERFPQFAAIQVETQSIHTHIYMLVITGENWIYDLHSRCINNTIMHLKICESGSMHYNKVLTLQYLTERVSKSTNYSHITLGFIFNYSFIHQE